MPVETEMMDFGFIADLCAAPSISPTNGADLCWFDEFGVHVEDRVSGPPGHGSGGGFFFYDFYFFFGP